MRLDTAAPPSVGPPVRTTGIKVFVATLAFGLLLAVVLAAAVERSARRRAELAEGDPDALLDESGRDERPKHDDESSGRDPDPAAAESRSADKGHAECPVEPDAGPDGDERPTQVVESSAAAERAATDRDAPDDGDDAPTEVGALSAIVAPRIRRPVLPPGRPVPPNHPGREAPVRDVVPIWRPVPRGARRHQLAGPPPGQQRSVGSPLVGQQRPLPPRRPVAPPPAGPTPPPARPTPPPAGSNPPWPARSVPPPAVDPLRPPRLAPPPGARPVPGDAPPAVDALRLPRLAPLPDARPMPADAPPTPQPPAAQTPLLAGTPLERSAASPPLAGPSARPPAPKPAKQSNRRPGEYHPALVSPFGPTDSATFDSSSLWAPARSPLPGSTGFLPATPLPAGVPGIGGGAREAAALEMPVSTLAEDDWAEPDEPEVAAAPPRSARGEASAERGQGPRGDDAGDDSLDWSDFDDLADEAAAEDPAGGSAEDPAGGSAAEDPANGSVAHPRSGSVVDGRQAGRTTG
jgi:hypothetical protein